MRNAKRGRGSHRGVYLCAAAALGFALSGCGGGGGAGTAATASSSQSATATSAGGTATGGTSTAGTSSASNPPTASSGAVTLNWTPPTENTDGSPLTNLTGYDIHYGSSPHNYTQTVTISNPGIATYVVDNLSPGKYYFSVTAINSQGAQSPLSAEVSTTVN